MGSRDLSSLSLRKCVKVVGWNTLAVGVVLLFVDAALRLTRFNDARSPAIGNPAGYYVTDDKLGVSIARNFPPSEFRFRGPGHRLFSNRYGCFDTPVRLGPNEPYILAIGDSFSWGYNALELKWTSIVERRSGLRVLKCGVSGTGTRYQVAHLKRLLAELPHAPQLVIHLYDTTDFNDDFTFPGETVVDGQRLENFGRIRLQDGARSPANEADRARKRRKIYDGDRGFLETRSVLYSILQILLLSDSRIEKRRLVLEGQKPTHLEWKYEFNLLLLDAGTYPYVAEQLGVHLNALREMRDAALGAGARYALFHTNSFRLPGDRGFAARLKRHLESMPEFLGWMPELDRHLFDPHWAPESEARVAEIMLDRLAGGGLLQDISPNQDSAAR